MYRADTIEELAGQCGMDPKVLRNSVERYEIACENGVDDLFGKNPDYLFPMGDGPYYAVEGICCPYHTMGGLEVDASMRVLDEDGKAILGLYAAGLESQANIFSGGACDDIINYGFLNWQSSRGMLPAAMLLATRCGGRQWWHGQTPAAEDPAVLVLRVWQCYMDDEARRPRLWGDEPLWYVSSCQDGSWRAKCTEDSFACLWFQHLDILPLLGPMNFPVRITSHWRLRWGR